MATPTTSPDLPLPRTIFSIMTQKAVIRGNAEQFSPAEEADVRVWGSRTHWALQGRTAETEAGGWKFMFEPP